MKYDRIIIGAGLYGLYSCELSSRNNQKILVLEHDSEAFKRATYINQARVHMGYHYPRSYSTAIKSAHYFERFMKDYDFSIMTKFDKIYAISSNFSYTNALQFKKFCEAVNIKCDSIDPSKYFNDKMCDGAFQTTEYTYDAEILKNHFLEILKKRENVTILYNSRIESIEKINKEFVIKLESGENVNTEFLLNATYASCNQILEKLGYEKFKIKYELCEIILCKVSDELKSKGITVMDGPFFSIMPFGKTGYHSLTSVTFTPHMTSYDTLPKFDCQSKSNGFCSPLQLGNCNECIAKPTTAWPYMSNMAKKYLKEEYKFEYVKSLFSVKPILLASEVDDSRPTIVKKFSENPTFVSVFSGKINTVYDLEEVLND